ncbi:MAG: glycosyl transferase [Bacteroidia bacterium]|nr:glycosyl transferase [Bacteroidia bacterium]
MKLLYAIQGTGNGHLSRARDVIPALMKHGDVDIIVSGTQSEVKLPHPILEKYKGLSFIYNKKGGLDYGKTISHNLSLKAWKEIKSVPVENYDLVINDFEPISAYACKMKKVPSVGMGHQASFWSEKTPRPARRDFLGEWILKNYAPADFAVGFHFERYDDFIYTPVVRSDVRNLSPTDEGHYTVYLPAFDEESLLSYLNQVPNTNWHVFSKFAKEPYQRGGVQVNPVNNERFMASFSGARGVLTGAGFETPAETLYLGKKLFAVPIKGQYEQYCNAVSLEKMGIPVLWKVDNSFVKRLRSWVEDGEPVQVDYADNIQEVVDELFARLARGIIKLRKN